MSDVLAVTAPIFLAIALGFLATWREWFAAADLRVLGRFVILVALPALLFRTLASRPLAEILNATYLLAYLGGSLAVLAGAWFWYRRAARLDEAASAFRAMGMACANSGFVGYPIVLLLFAPAAGVSLALNMLVENVALIPLLLLLAERGRRDAGIPAWRAFGASLLRLGRNPLVLAILAGLAASLAGLRLPSPMVRTIDMFAAASAALSLFVIGGNLVGLPMEGLGRDIAPIVAGKLVLHPLAVLLALEATRLAGLPPLDPMLRHALLVMAATPMLGIYPALAQAHGQARIAAPALLATTLASFATLSGLLWILGRAGP